MFFKRHKAMQREESYEEQIRNCSAQLKDVSIFLASFFISKVISRPILNKNF
jgi:hypothetical protein